MSIQILLVIISDVQLKYAAAGGFSLLALRGKRPARWVEGGEGGA